MTASRSHALFAMWAVVMLAATMQASGIRNLLQPPQCKRLATQLPDLIQQSLPHHIMQRGCQDVAECLL